MRYLLLVTILLPAFGAVVVSAWSRHVRRLRVCALASSWSCVVCAIVLSVHHQTTFTGRRSNPADQYQYRSAVVLVSGSVTEEAGRAARAAVIRVALAVNEIRLLLIVSTALLTSAVLHCLAGRDGPHNPAVVMLVLVTESFVLVALAAFDIVLYAVAVGCVGMCLSAATGLGCPHRAGKAESQFHAGIVSTTVLLTVGSVILVVGCAWVNAAYSGAQAAPGFALHQLHIAADRAIRSGGPLLNVWYWASAWAFLCFAGAFLVQAGAFPIHAWRRQLAWGLDEPLLALCLASTARLGLFGLIWIIVPL